MHANAAPFGTILLRDYFQERGRQLFGDEWAGEEASPLVPKLRFQIAELRIPPTPEEVRKRIAELRAKTETLEYVEDHRWRAHNRKITLGMPDQALNGLFVRIDPERLSGLWGSREAVIDSPEEEDVSPLTRARQEKVDQKRARIRSQAPDGYDAKIAWALQRYEEIYWPVLHRGGTVAKQIREDAYNDKIKVETYNYMSGERHPVPKEVWVGAQYEICFAMGTAEINGSRKTLIVDRALPMQVRKETGVSKQPQVTADSTKHSDKPSRRGRPKGSGAYASDPDLLKEMHELIESKKAANPTQAATQVAHRADGQSEESTIKRLVQKFIKEYAAKQ